jgi:hypothetical protein
LDELAVTAERKKAGSEATNKDKNSDICQYRLSWIEPSSSA